MKNCGKSRHRRGCCFLFICLGGFGCKKPQSLILGSFLSICISDGAYLDVLEGSSKTISDLKKDEGNSTALTNKLLRELNIRLFIKSQKKQPQKRLSSCGC
jgi:hypothetical protein